MTTIPQDILKRLLSSHFEKGAVDSAAEFVASLPSSQGSPADEAMILGGMSLALSIATSLKRIADALEPAKVEGVPIPNIKIGDEWLISEHRLLGTLSLSTLVEIEYHTGTRERWMLGDAIDWAHPEPRRLKSTLRLWRPVKS